MHFFPFLHLTSHLDLLLTCLAERLREVGLRDDHGIGADATGLLGYGAASDVGVVGWVRAGVQALQDPAHRDRGGSW